MRTDYRLAWVAGVAGVLLLLAPGCSKKTIQADAGAKSSEQQVVKSSTARPEGRGPGTPGASLSEQDLNASRSMPSESPDAGVGSLAQAPTPSPRGSEPLSGLEPVAPGQAPAEEPVAGGIVVAKVMPSDGGRVEQMQKEQLAAASAELKDVFFGFDSWTITEEAKGALARDADWLKANPANTLTIEGHCDERGTLAYNLVLGEKRAKAVRNYLVELGVNGERLKVVSYGKERPFCKEHEEGCYQQNRRSHLVLRVQ